MHTDTDTDTGLDVARLPLLRGPAFSPRCGECPFATKDGAANRPVPGEGPRNPRWLVVGEGPGQTEVQRNRPFVGMSGKMVDKALAAIKVPREQLFVTNATLCLPSANATDTMKHRARECCAPRLALETAQFPGVPILALGGVAAQGFLGDKFSITAMAGSLHSRDVDGTGEREIIPTVHPAAILRGGAGVTAGAHAVDLLFWNLIYDAAKVDRLARGQEVRFTNDIDWETEDAARAETLIEWIVTEARRVRLVAVDTETYADEEGHSALEPLHARMSAIGLACPRGGISVAWAILTPRARRLIAAVLGDSTIRKVCHNRLYDRPVLAHHGLPIRGPNDCTLLMHHSAFPGLAHDLQRVATQFFAISPWKAEFREGDGELDELCEYNALDALATVRLHAPLLICLQRGSAEKTYEVDLKMAEIAERMHVVGVPVSHEVNAQLTVRFREDIARARIGIEERASDLAIREDFLDRLAFEQAKRVRKIRRNDKGKPAKKLGPDPEDFLARHAVRMAEAKNMNVTFDIDTAEHLVAYLKARKVPLYQETEKGKISTQRDILEGLVHIPEVRAILDYREASKMLSTFVEKLPHYMDVNGRIHPVWSVNKITGRWGAERPQVMNWPKTKKKIGRPNLRTQVVAPRGRIFVGADFSQLEARIIALLSGDPFLCSIFQNYRDIHSEFARIVWPNFDQLPPDERKELRDQIKRPEYGAFYGGAIDTLWKAVVKDYPKVLIQDIALMVKVITEKMPGVTAWHEKLLRQVQIELETRSFLYGRRRAFPLGNAEATAVYNFGVQSAAADIMGFGLSQLVAALPQGADVILQIHDAVVVECDEGQADEVAAIVKTTLSQSHTVDGVTIEFPVDAKIGASWADV